MNPRLQLIHAGTERRERVDRRPQQPRVPDQWRTVKELVVQLRFPSDKACRAWLTRQGIGCVKRGRIILVNPVDVDRALNKVI